MFSRIVILAMVCFISRSQGYPEGQLRAKSIPFHLHEEQRQPLIHLRSLEPEALVRDVPLRQVIYIKPVQERSEERVIPKAPVLNDEERPSVAIRSQPIQAGQVLRSKADEDAALFKKQAESAHYAFETYVDDGINGHSHLRSEKRDGLSVEGMYSYSDGFFRRTIHYAADDKGYRVTKEEVVPIGDGPLVDPEGEAVVRSSLGSQYTITKADLQAPEDSEKILKSH